MALKTGLFGYSVYAGRGNSAEQAMGIDGVAGRDCGREVKGTHIAGLYAIAKGQTPETFDRNGYSVGIFQLAEPFARLGIKRVNPAIAEVADDQCPA